jgi:cytochrome c553
MITHRFATVIASIVAMSIALPARAIDPNLGRNIAATCTSCHGANGISGGGIPSLAGQPSQALIAALQAFRAGTRPATVMQQLAKGYTDSQIEAVAAYFAAQQAR